MQSDEIERLRWKAYLANAHPFSSHFWNVMRSQKRRNGANNTSKKMLTLDKDIVPIRNRKVCTPTYNLYRMKTSWFLLKLHINIFECLLYGITYQRIRSYNNIGVIHDNKDFPWCMITSFKSQVMILFMDLFMEFLHLHIVFNCFQSNRQQYNIVASHIQTFCNLETFWNGLNLY